MRVLSRSGLRAGVVCIAIVAGGMLWSLRTDAAAGPATQPSPAEAARLARGREIRSVLLNLLDQIDNDSGAWPDKLTSPDAARLSLVYSKPESLGEPGFLTQLQAVVHEPPGKFPGGVWVGYADGHVEFAPTPADLAACEGQLRIVHDVLARYKNPWGPNPEVTVDSKAAAKTLVGELTLRIVDPQRRAVAGALVGVAFHRGDEYTPADERVMFWTEPKNLPAVASIAEMDRKLDVARKDVWGGRDLPFLVALDGGGRVRIPGTGIFTRGRTNAAYHVWIYPTTYLIGRDGTVLRDLWINNPDEQPGIEKTIDDLVNNGNAEVNR